MPITPLNDRVIVKVIEPEETVKNGLFIPENAREKPSEGVVIAIGSGKVQGAQFVPLEVETGMKVLFGKYSGTEVKVDDEELLILREEEIFAKLT